NTLNKNQKSFLWNLFYQRQAIRVPYPPTHNFYLPCITKRQDTPQQNIMDKTALPEGTYKKVID
ncbi:hypothetical protein, partial [Barnesiella intestinihominis]